MTLEQLRRDAPAWAWSAQRVGMGWRYVGTLGDRRVTGAHPGSDPPSPSVPRRRAFRRLENILQVVVVANALRESAGRDRLTDEDLRTASSICRSEVLA